MNARILLFVLVIAIAVTACASTDPWGEISINETTVVFKGQKFESESVRILVDNQDFVQLYEDRIPQSTTVAWEGMRRIGWQDRFTEIVPEGKDANTLFKDERFILCEDNHSEIRLSRWVLIHEDAWFSSCSQWITYEEAVLQATDDCPNELVEASDRQLFAWNEGFVETRYEVLEDVTWWTIEPQGYRLNVETHFEWFEVGRGKKVAESVDELFVSQVAQTDWGIMLCFWEGHQKPTPTPTATNTAIPLFKTTPTTD